MPRQQLHTFTETNPSTVMASIAARPDAEAVVEPGLCLGYTAPALTAVVAAPDARLGEHARAIARMRPGAKPVSLGDMTAHLSGVGLARQKWPAELRLVDDFPRTASGKIRKVDLRAWLRSEPPDDARLRRPYQKEKAP